MQYSNILDITFYVIIETKDELNPLAREMMQNDLNTVITKYSNSVVMLLQKFPWILADTDAVTAFEESSLIPLKSLDSEVFKVNIARICDIF